MTSRDKLLMAGALAPSLLYVSGLLGLMAWRRVYDASPVPHGWTPYLTGLSVMIPLGSVSLANFIRLRRRA